MTLDAEECPGRIYFGGAAGLTRRVVFETLGEIHRGADVEGAGLQAEEVDDGLALGRAWILRGKPEVVGLGDGDAFITPENAEIGADLSPILSD